MNSTAKFQETIRVLDVDAMLKEARRMSGLDNYGEDSFVAPLRKMMECMARDTNFHAAGLKEFRNTLLQRYDMGPPIIVGAQGCHPDPLACEPSSMTQTNTKNSLRPCLSDSL